MKTGYMALSKLSWMTPKINKIAADTVKNLESLPGIELVHPEGPVVDEKSAVAAAEFFVREKVAAVVMHFVTFPAGALIPAVAQRLDCPILLLANPEKATAEGIWEQNSFCGANLGGFVMKRLGKKYSFVRAMPEETAEAVAPALAAARCIGEAKNFRIGLAGGRVPGFYTSNFDEMELRRRFGVTVEVLDLLEIADTAKKLSPELLSSARDTVGHSAAGVVKVPDRELELAAELLGAFRKTAEKYSLSAFAVRCWPEFSDLFGIAPCAVLGMLSSGGMPASCEGDVPGAVTMSMLRSIAGGGIPIFVDLISYDTEKNTGVIWHCGAAPVALCRKFEETRLRLHMRVDGGDRKGVTNDFSLKSGRITVAKLDQDENGKFRMLILPGTALDTKPFLRGNPLEIKFDAPVGKMVDTILKRGFEHHYAAIHADVSKELLQFCDWMDIEPVYLGE